MNITYAERQALNALSLEVYGASSKWQKLVTKGYLKTVTETQEEMVPGKDGEPDTVKEVQVPVRFGNNGLVQMKERLTIESVKERMLFLKKFKEDHLAAQAARKAAAEQKSLEDSVNNELAGSAVHGG